MQRCIPRILPPWTWRAMGSMDLRSSALHWPTMELKKGSRGSLRAKHPRNWSWKAWSSSRNPSTSRGVRSNCGMENTSPSVRCAGNIFCLLVVICAFGGSVDRENQPVKYRCRCRDIIARCIRTLDEQGNVTGEKYFDPHGKATRNTDGIAGYLATYDSDGNQIEIRYLGPDGSPGRDNLGIARVSRSYDDRRQLVEERYFDLDDSPVENADGHHRITYSYAQNPTRVTT